MTFREIKSRLGVAQLLLRGDMDDASRSSMSRLQSLAAIELMTSQSTVLTASESADLASFAATIPWCVSDLGNILTALEGSSPTPPKRRRPQQDFKALVHYFSAAEWSDLFQEGTGKDLKLQKILMRGYDLGLRTPSEQSLKLIASLWMAVSESPATLSNLDAVQKSANLSFTKLQFDQLRRRDGSDPAIWWDTLPAPLEYLNKQQNLFKAIFRDSMPVPPTDELTTMLMQLDMSYGCRNAGGKRIQAFEHCNVHLAKVSL